MITTSKGRLSSIELLSRWDCILISDIASESMRIFIDRFADIERIADRFCNGKMIEAWDDILEKGIIDILMMCDMDDKINSEGHL